MMTYRIRGLAAEPFAPMFGLDDEALAARMARRVVADADRGFPCRVSLEDARRGEELLLVQHVHNPAAGPFRASHAIFVRRGVQPAAAIDRLPAMLDSRQLSLRGLDRDADIVTAALVVPGEGDQAIREIFADSRIVAIHAHNPAWGCYLATIERHEGGAA